MRIAQVGTGYGMTETCGLAAFTRPGSPSSRGWPRNAMGKVLKNELRQLLV